VPPSYFNKNYQAQFQLSWKRKQLWSKLRQKLEPKEILRFNKKLKNIFLNMEKDLLSKELPRTSQSLDISTSTLLLKPSQRLKFRVTQQLWLKLLMVSVFISVLL